jgi:hypothetical protein
MTVKTISAIVIIQPLDKILRLADVKSAAAVLQEYTKNIAKKRGVRILPS